MKYEARNNMATTDTVKKNTVSTTAPKKAAPKKVVKKTVKKAINLDAKIFDIKGKESGKITLPEGIFGLKWNGDLVHQVVIAQQANARIILAHTKDRSEVRGGGKKPWRQKGTGRARHGSNRSPIWKGGGVTFGPRKEKDYTQKASKKMRNKAVFTILSQKFRDGELIFIDNVKMAEPKTKEAKAVIDALAKVKGNARLVEKKINTAMLLLAERDTETAKSFRNLSGIYVEETRNMNPVNLLTYKYVIIAKPEEAIKFLEGKIVGKGDKK